MRKITLLTAAAAVSLLSCFPAFAGEWKQDQTGWWYDHGDSTYAQNGWEWVDGRCYYFDSEGYCLLDTTTPDGYTVDDSGAWTIDGVVQLQAESDEAAEEEAAEASSPEIVQVGSLTVQTPDGFVLADSADGTYVYTDSTGGRAISVVCQTDEDLAAFEDEALSALKDSILDYAMQVNMGDYTSRSSVELTSGSWMRYQYASIQNLGAEGTMDAYIRLKGAEMQIIAFAGALEGTDTLALMNTCVK